MTNWRAVRSAAITVRASVVSIAWKLSLNPRTPESAPTPAATASTTNRNLVIDERVSRQAMRAAVRNDRFIRRAAPRRLANFVRDDLAVAQRHDAIGMFGERRDRASPAPAWCPRADSARSAVPARARR